MNRRLAGAAATVLTALILAACGGGSSAAKVGDCIDASNHVVDCSSSSATHKLVSDQEALQQALRAGQAV